VQLKDRFEPRLGFEYAMLDMSHPVFVRFGAWREPAHNLNFVGDPESFGSSDLEEPGNRRLDAVFNATLFSTGDPEMHFSGGFGVAFESFQIDFAADVSD